MARRAGGSLEERGGAQHPHARDGECDDGGDGSLYGFRPRHRLAAEEKEAARHAEELLAEVEAEKRAKGKKGKKKKKGGGSGGAGPSQEREAPAEAAAAKPAPLDKEGLLRLLAELHEDRIRFGITPETRASAAAARARAREAA
ncbi:hypothetical protein EMIHUDRAFT_196591 [Emiliania huxleyi CCMP1516]|uniref:Uncharacterized protein n=2 Tax=Emiliania huxleyi TaxID=2903 RepID=A0A0D3J4D9_EMIH1|nr:hypothetical protein EMIHUDRAFT_196591 [Emiliania huxleyi CCMP1516]EOD18374.1 hypothetical protein EMIHUDRAFT_196591 [Emiliania huxleyi CCMP1516]|eukprot:XP_005770803.1 hypothetical protein EMIHUDRAFT_196591 [Emiliania huxleyi CCMP1516]